MASAASGSDAPAPDAAPSFTVEIKSPTTGVPQPLVFHALSPDTTVRQLKLKISEAVPVKPSEQSQRLIYRGRLLHQSDQSMASVFGHSPVRSSEQQILHLVITVSNPPAAQIPPPATPQPTISGAADPQQQQQQEQRQQQPPPQQHTAAFPQPPQNRIGATPWGNPAAAVPQTNTSFPPGVPTIAQPGQLPPGYTPQQFMQHQHQWVNTMNALDPQRGRPRVDALANQAHLNPAPHDRTFEEMLAQHYGQHFAQHPMANAQRPQDAAASSMAAPPAGPHGTISPFGASAPFRTASPHPPDGTRTVVREGYGPNGQQWRVTVNETVNTIHRPGRAASPLAAPHNWRPHSAAPQSRSVPPGGPLTAPDLDHIMRSADTTQATRTITDAMRRNASSPSLSNLARSHANHPPVQPGVTVPMFPSRAPSAAGTPDPLRAAAAQAPGSFPRRTNGSPEVYILSSPSGPRAVLLNGNADTYYSPQGRASVLPMPNTLPVMTGPFSAAFSSGFSAFPTPTQGHLGQRSPATTIANTPHPASPRPQPQQNIQAGQPPAQGQGQRPQVRVNIRQNNPGIEAVGFAQLWPHIWMVIRLGLFVWWFTSPTSSWSRWFTVVGIAFVLFLVNTGLLNPLVDRFWVPLRQHLEDLIPRADAHHQPRPQHLQRRQHAGAEGEHGVNDLDRETNPAEAAARLVQQHQENNASWLANQVRRLERAGILFLASIAPGVAERHIAHLEEEARVERRRIEAAEAAAAAAAEAARNEDEANANNENQDGLAVEPSVEGAADDQDDQGEDRPDVEFRAPEAEALAAVG